MLIKYTNVLRRGFDVNDFTPRQGRLPFLIISPSTVCYLKKKDGTDLHHEGAVLVR